MLHSALQSKAVLDTVQTTKAPSLQQGNRLLGILSLLSKHQAYKVIVCSV